MMPHKKLLLEQVSEKGPDIAAAGSAVFAGAAWVAEAEPLVTLVAGLVTIVAGATAAVFHIERTRSIRVDRKLKEKKLEKMEEE